MKILVGKLKAIAAVAVFLLLASVVLMAVPVEAQTTLPAGVTPTNVQDGGSVPLPAGVTPDVTLDTVPGLSFRPNPVGVGQTFAVNIWIANVATHASRHLSDFKVTITKPSGTTDVITIDSYIGDATAWFEYVADEVGEWKLQFEFPGGYFPAGNYTVPAEAYLGAQTVSFTQSCYYEPSKTAEQTLVVQEEQVTSWTDNPLPSGYWTRPVSSDDRNWASILGDYPWRGPGTSSSWPEDTNRYWSSNYRFTPYVQAPNSAHIVWKRQDAIGGIIGGDYGQLSYPLAIIGVSNFPTIVYAGRCYQTVTKPFDGVTQSVWQCYDLRTGEVYWERTGVSAPSAIEYYIAGGEHPGETAWIGVGTSVTLVYIGGGRLIKYNPLTGAVAANASISPMTTGTYYMNGYALTVQNLGNALPVEERYRLINWTTYGTTDNFTSRIVSNITWPFSSIPATTDYNAGVAVSINSPSNPAVGAGYGTMMQAASLTTGALLWNKTVEDTLMLGTEVADHGKIVFIPRGPCYAMAFNLRDGSSAWTSDKLDYPWGHWLSYTGQSSAYGLYYVCGYDGMYAFDWDTGKLAWKYTAVAENPYETVYVDEAGQTVYSFAGQSAIADGKLYAYNSEHTVTQPITRGWGLHCINATTGEGIWNITGVSTPGPIADGYLTAGSMQDGCMYVFGKGKSVTTIEAPLTAITLGQSVVLKGSVLDQSPAQPDTPCVSQESMASWMEYLHMQTTIPATVTGVPVSLDTVDPNGNFVHIADVVTDGYSGTFGYTWTPDVPGQYAVTATFMGDDSYGSSFAQTYVTVSEAPPASATPEPPQSPPDNTLLLYVILVVGIIAIILSLIALLRKR